MKSYSVVKDCTGQVQKSVLFYLVCKNSVTAIASVHLRLDKYH